MKALAFMEAVLMPIPSWDAMPRDLKETFQAFRTPEVGWDMIVNQHMFIEQILPSLIVRDLTDAELDHYRAPYTDPPSRKPLWRWPNEIPIAGEPAVVVAIVEEYNRKLQQSRLPKLLFSAHPQEGSSMPKPFRGVSKIYRICKWSTLARAFISSKRTTPISSGPNWPSGTAVCDARTTHRSGYGTLSLHTIRTPAEDNGDHSDVNQYEHSQLGALAQLHAH